MIICGIFAVAGGITWIIGRKRFSAGRTKSLGILMLASVLGLLAGIANDAEAAYMEEGVLKRNAYGEGSYEQTLTLEIEGEAGELNYEVKVPEQILTKEQEAACLEAAAEEIQREFSGENETVNHIEQCVVIRDVYQGGKVLATWSFDDYDVMNLKGEVIAEELPEEGTLVKAKVQLICGETEQTEEFYFRVFLAPRDETEELIWQIDQVLKAQADAPGELYLKLPKSIGNQRLTWHTKSNHESEKILFLGMIIAVFVPFLEHSRAQERKKQRERLLELEYPELVSKLALLLSAGMTLQGALRKIAFSYEEKRKQKTVDERPAYEELIVTCREIENGMGECTAYERFGNHCGNSEYRKLGNLLAQNLRKGSYHIVELLEQESRHAFEARRDAAKKCGEEAGTKLLIPMMLMLGLVMIVLLIPAVLAFQIK